MYGILVTRFNDETYAENQRCRERTGIKCIYSEQKAISNYLPECTYFVIEMNNSTNEIMGIGVIQNKLQEKMKVYENPYNRYVYKGDMHIPISSINSQIVEELENILFYGKSHSKRGHGLTMFPSKRLKPEFIREFISVHNSLQKSCP
jgi:hypothetical protein